MVVYLSEDMLDEKRRRNDRMVVYLSEDMLEQKRRTYINGMRKLKGYNETIFNEEGMIKWKPM